MDAFPFAGLAVRGTPARPAQTEAMPADTPGDAAAVFAGLIDEDAPLDLDDAQANEGAVPADVPVAPVIPLEAPAAAMPPALDEAPVLSTPNSGTAAQAAPAPLPTSSPLESILAGWTGLTPDLASEPTPDLTLAMAAPALPALPQAAGSGVDEPQAALSLAAPQGALPGHDAAPSPRVSLSATESPEAMTATRPTIATSTALPAAAPATPATVAVAAPPAPPAPVVAADPVPPAEPTLPHTAAALTASTPVTVTLPGAAKPRAAPSPSAPTDAAPRSDRGDRVRDRQALTRLYDLATHGAGPAASVRLSLSARPGAAGTEAGEPIAGLGSDLRFDLGLARDLPGASLRAEGAAQGHGMPRLPDHHATAISRQIAQVAVTLSHDEIELALAPEELGKLRLRVSRAEGHGPVVTVWFEHPDVLDTARRHLDQLVQDLRDSGLEGASLDLRGDQGGGQRPSDPGALTGEAGEGTGEPGTGTPVLPQTIAPARQLSDRHLDIRV